MVAIFYFVTSLRIRLTKGSEKSSHMYGMYLMTELSVEYVGSYIKSVAK